MPKGLLSRLIVRLNRYLKDFDLAWQNGVIIERYETKALIRETYASRSITINVLGILAKEFITIISEELDILNETFPYLKVQKLIQCNCNICLESDAPHFYDYKKLQKRIIIGRQTVECELSYKDINVKSLIDGVFTTVHRKKDENMHVFISYSHKDEKYKDELLNHLKSLKLEKNIFTWDDTDILPGQKWDETIKEKMKTSDIILLLVSSDFIASSYIWKEELPIAIERDNKGEAIVIPIFVRECDMGDLPFMKLQGLPKNSKPISKFRNKDEAYTEISKGIRRRLNKMVII